MTNKSHQEVAIATSRGTLHKHIMELHNQHMDWHTIKTQLLERFSECGSSTMAKHKLAQLRQNDLPMHEYIAKFSDMTEHAYNIRPDQDESQILASTFIEHVQNPYIKNKLRSYQVKNLKEIYDHAIKEDHKQKIRAIDFGDNNKEKTEQILNCDINALQGTKCYKCGEEGHYARECLQSKDDKYSPNRYPNKQYDSKTSPKYQGTNDMFDPMTKLFNSLLEQMKKLQKPSYTNNSNHTHHNAYDRNSKRYKPRQGFKEHTHNKKFNNYRKGYGTKVHEMETFSDCHSDCSEVSEGEDGYEEDCSPSDEAKN